MSTAVAEDAQDYAAFLESKTQMHDGSGFEPVWMPDFLFDFQRSLVEWAIRQGRCALFEDCGMGKTAQYLVWAENVHRKTGRPVLVTTPLAVAPQTLREATKFGITAGISRDGSVAAPITITNYEQLHHFTPGDYAGMVCDESSILKSFSGATRKAVTAFAGRLSYRLLCTATAAPNDYVELGTSSDALGELRHFEMLERFFVSDENTVHPRSFAGGRRIYVRETYRLKGHAEQAFWRWVASWARALRKPSDLGYEDGGFQLPALVEHETVIDARTPTPGRLFEIDAFGLSEVREEQRRTIPERCEIAAALAIQEPIAIVWCHLNGEGDTLERLIPNAIQVKGADSLEWKEAVASWFKGGLCICDLPLFRRKVRSWRDVAGGTGCICGHVSGIRRMVSKPSIFGWGLNLQCCHHVIYFPSYSYEAYYQAIRRCWRFGQQHPVAVHIVRTKAQQPMMDSLHHKSQAADHMFSALVKHMNDALRIQRSATQTHDMEIPQWLRA